MILTTTSILQLQEKLLGTKNFDFILTSRFNQDCIENLFSVLRYKRAIPTALQFKNNLKLICIAQYLKCASKSMSYDADDREFLSGFLDIISEQKDKQIIQEIEEIGGETFMNGIENLNDSEKNVLYYIAGYILLNIKTNEKICNECFQSICSNDNTNIDTNISNLVTLKNYKKGCSLYATEDTYNFFLHMEIKFRSLEHDLYNKQIGCHKYLIRILKLDSVIQQCNFKECHNIKDKIMSRFIAFRLKIFGLKKKRQIRKCKAKLKHAVSSKSATICK